MSHLFTLNNLINAVLTAVIVYFFKALFFDNRDVAGAVIFGVLMFFLHPLILVLFSHRNRK